MVKDFSGASSERVVPAPIVAPFFTVTGAINSELEPMKESSSMVV